MKNAFLKILSVIMVMLLTLPCVPTSAAQKNKDFSVAIDIKERNGIAVKDFFFRRGIAFEKGTLYDENTVCLKENGAIIISAAEVMDRYDDGSIAWLLVSGKTDLKPNELKKLILTDGISEKTSTSFAQTGSCMTVSSEKISMKLSPNGIESLTYNGVEQLNGIPINLYVTIGGKTDYLHATEISVLKHTNSYSKFKLKGKLNKAAYGEMYITIAKGASVIEVEHRLNLKDTLMVQSTGLTIGATYTALPVGTVVNSDYLDVGSMQLASYENTRFNDACGPAKNTGYVIGENQIDFAPIINMKEYKWHDGVSRSVHLHIGFSDTAEGYAAALSLPPSVSVDANQYKKAGQISSVKTNGLFYKLVDTFKYSYEKTNGRFAVGGVCETPNRAADVTGSVSSVCGELEYNMGIGWMQCGDEELFRHIADCAEMRSDIAVYRGMHSKCVGVMRAQVGLTKASAFQSHGYYSDEGGLYMAYLLTGNEWIYESYKLCIEKTLTDMYSEPAVGARMPDYWYWGGDTGNNPYAMPKWAEFCEVRGLIRARTLYLAGELFEDKRYRDAAYEMVKWAENVQRPDGSFAQATYDDRKKYYQGAQTQEPIKDNIMLYGFRGVAQLLEFENDERTLTTTLNLADYFCGQVENFGPTLVNPNANGDVYWLHESNFRTSCPMTNSLAIDLMRTAFEQTGSERYLKVLLQLLESYFCNEMGGLGGGGVHRESPGGSTPSAGDSLRCSTLFKCLDNLIVIMEENHDKIMDMGFEDVLLAMEKGSLPAKEGELINDSFPYITHNIYETGNEKALFLTNKSSSDPTTHDWDRTVRLNIEENRLWEGTKNIVKDIKSVTLEKYLIQWDLMTAIQRPLYIDEFYGSEADIEIKAYNEKEIKLCATGNFELGLKIESGTFVIDENKGYTVSVVNENGKTCVTVTEGGSLKPQNGALYVRFDGLGNILETVGIKALDGVGLSGSDVNASLSDEQLNHLLKKVSGKEVVLSKTPTWKEFGAALAGAMILNNSMIFETAGLQQLLEVDTDIQLSDEEAVQHGVNALSVEYEGDELGSNVFLAKESIFGTTVEWQSDREDILTSEGILNREAVDCETITLTATARRNNASAVRKFTIPLMQKKYPYFYPGPGFERGSNSTSLNTHKEEFEISFTVTPQEDGIDAIISLNNSEIKVGGNGDTPYLIRFWKDNRIDAIDNTQFKTETPIYYESGKEYYVRMVVRPDRESYDVYVRGQDEKEEAVIAKNYSPRSSAPHIEAIDILWCWSAKPMAYKVTNLTQIHYKNTEPIGNGMYDENKLMFGKYGKIPEHLFPAVSENGKLINWVSVESEYKMNGGNMRFSLGAEDTVHKTMNLTDVLRQARLLDIGVTEDDNVTPASLTRIINAIEAEKNYLSE